MTPEGDVGIASLFRSSRSDYFDPIASEKRAKPPWPEGYQNKSQARCDSCKSVVQTIVTLLSSPSWIRCLAPVLLCMAWLMREYPFATEWRFNSPARYVYSVRRRRPRCRKCQLALKCLKRCHGCHLMRCGLLEADGGRTIVGTGSFDWRCGLGFLGEETTCNQSHGAYDFVPPRWRTRVVSPARHYLWLFCMISVAFVVAINMIKYFAPLPFRNRCRPSGLPGTRPKPQQAKNLRKRITAVHFSRVLWPFLLSFARCFRPE